MPDTMADADTDTTRPSLSFRHATLQDAAALEVLINKAFRADHTTQVFLSPDHDTVDVTSAAALAAKIAQPETAVLVAVEGGDGDGGGGGGGGTAAGAAPPVAHCCVRLMADGATAWLGLLAVDVDRQRRGLGGRVVAYAERYARRELGARRLEFDVVNTRADLIAFYARRGFRPTGTKLPFPYDSAGAWRGVLRSDLEFVVFRKELEDEEPAAEP